MYMRNSLESTQAAAKSIWGGFERRVGTQPFRLVEQNRWEGTKLQTTLKKGDCVPAKKPTEERAGSTRESARERKGGTAVSRDRIQRTQSTVIDSDYVLGNATRRTTYFIQAEKG